MATGCQKPVRATARRNPISPLARFGSTRTPHENCRAPSSNRSHHCRRLSSSRPDELVLLTSRNSRRAALAGPPVPRCRPVAPAHTPGSVSNIVKRAVSSTLSHCDQAVVQQRLKCIEHCPSSSHPQTCSAASSVHPPTNTPSRRNRRCSRASSRS